MITGHYLMKWGLFKGKPLADVPGDYLLYIYHDGKAHGALREYIKMNMAGIRSQISKQKQLANQHEIRT